MDTMTDYDQDVADNVMFSEIEDLDKKAHRAIRDGERHEERAAFSDLSAALKKRAEALAEWLATERVERMKAESERDSYSSELDALNETLADADHMTHGDDYRRIHDAVVTIVDDLRRDNEVLDHLARFHDDNHAGARYFCAEEPCSYLRQHADVNLHLDVA